MRSPIDPKLGEKIIAEFLSEKRHPGDLFWSEHEIAKRFGVKRYAAMVAVRGLVKRGVLTRVQGKGTFLADNIEVTFNFLNRHRIHLAFVTPTWGHDEKHGGFITELAAELTTRARQTNSSLTLFSEPGCLDDPLFPARLKMSGCNVLLCADPSIEALVGLADIRRSGFPAIVLAFPQAVFERMRIPVIHGGDRRVMSLLVKRLWSEGKKRIRLIGTLKRHGYHERYLGCREAMEHMEHRLPAGFFINSGDDDTDIATLRQELASRQPPQALIFQQYVTFLKAWSALPELSAAAVNGTELVVFDAVHLEKRLPDVPLTRIVPDAALSAAKVMELAGKLIREAAVPAKVEVPSRVIRPASETVGKDAPPKPPRGRGRAT